jgi:hypothetical protein
MTQEAMIVVRKPADLVDATPYVIGFHPTESLVVLGLTGSRILFGARHDLPPPEGDDLVHLGAVVAAQRPRSIALLAYGPPAAADPVIQRALPVFDAFRVRVTEALRVHDSRWWSYFCGENNCCPPDGTPYDTATSVIAAEATFRGQVVLPDRQALVSQVAPVDGEARAAMVVATKRACETLQRLITDEQLGERAVRRAGRLAVRESEKRYRTGGVLSDDEAALLGVFLIDTEIRDYALERPGEQEWRLALWTGMLRRVEPAYVPAVGSVLGYLAWRAGQGALARVAIDRALHEDPQHQMSALLDEVLGLGVGPHALTALEGPARILAIQRAASAHALRFTASRGKESPPAGEAPSGPASGPGQSGPPSPDPGRPSRRARRFRRRSA